MIIQFFLFSSETWTHPPTHFQSYLTFFLFCYINIWYYLLVISHVGDTTNKLKNGSTSKMSQSQNIIQKDYQWVCGRLGAVAGIRRRGLCDGLTLTRWRNAMFRVAGATN